MVLPIIASAAKGLVSSTAKKKTASSMAQDAVSNYTKKREEKKSYSQKSTKPEETTTSSNYSYKKPKTPKVKIPKVKNESLKSSLVSLQKGLEGITKNLKGLVKQKEKGDKEKKNRRRKVNKSLKEMGMEKISGVYSISKSIVNKIPFIDRIKKFFVNVLLGSIVTWLINNFETVVKVFTDIVKKIKEVFDLLNKYIFTPIFEVGKFLVKTIWPIIEGIMKLPPVDGAIKEIEKLMGEFEKLIPGFKSAKTDLERKKAELEGKDPPSPPQPSGTQSGSAPSTDGFTPAKVIPGVVSGDVVFRDEVTEVAKRLDISEDYLYTVMDFETGGTFDPAQKNAAGSGATGLIQFTERTARGLGTSTQELSKMSRAEQLKYVEKFLKNAGVKGGESLSDLYMTILFPAAKGKSDDFVLFGKGAMSGFGPGSRAYKQNRGLDINNDGSVTKAEASKKVMDRLPVAARKTQPPQTQSSSQPPSSPIQTSRTTPLQSELPALPPTETGSYAAAQKYGAPRKGGRRHAGQDYDADDDGIFYSRIGGEVTLVTSESGGYGNYVDIYNAELGVTERIAEGDVTLVKEGDIIKPGTAVQRGTSQTGVFHYEIRKGREETYGFKGTEDPVKFLQNLDNNIKQRRKKEQSTPPAQQVSQLENPNTNLYELLTNPLVTEEIAMNTDNLQYSSDDVQMERPTTDSVARSVSKKASYEGQKVIAMFSLPTPQNNSTGAIVQKPNLSMSSGSSPQSNSNTYYKTLTIRNQYST